MLRKNHELQVQVQHFYLEKIIQEIGNFLTMTLKLDNNYFKERFIVFFISNN